MDWRLKQTQLCILILIILAIRFIFTLTKMMLWFDPMQIRIEHLLWLIPGDLLCSVGEPIWLSGETSVPVSLVFTYIPGWTLGRGDIVLDGILVYTWIFQLSWRRCLLAFTVFILFHQDHGWLARVDLESILTLTRILWWVNIPLVH